MAEVDRLPEFHEYLLVKCRNKERSAIQSHQAVLKFYALYPEVTRETMDAFIEYLKQKYQITTANRIRLALNRWCDFIGKSDCRVTNNMDDVRALNEADRIEEEWNEACYCAKMLASGKASIVTRVQKDGTRVRFTQLKVGGGARP